MLSLNKVLIFNLKKKIPKTVIFSWSETIARCGQICDQICDQILQDINYFRQKV